MNYEIRLTAFLDILGFGKLVEASALEPDLANKIFDMLSSIHPSKVNEDAYYILNTDIVDPDKIDDVKKTGEKFAKALQQQFPVTISYFSDSLVLSANAANNATACFIILELVAKLSVRIWEEYRLLIRGGITIDRLIHQENGPLFGPAMNNAYYLESKNAVNPRVIMDERTIGILKQDAMYKTMEQLFEDSGDYWNINLASSYNHLINFSAHAMIPNIREAFKSSLIRTPVGLQEQIEKFKDQEGIQSKYIWIKEQVDKLITNSIEE